MEASFPLVTLEEENLSQVGSGGPAPTSPRGPGSPPLGRGRLCARTYHRTCRGSSALGSTPPPGPCPCRTAHAGSGSSHTLLRRGAGDASDADTLELESSETLWLRRGLPAPRGPLSVLRHTLVSRGEVWLLKSPHRTMSGHPSAAPGDTGNMTMSEPSALSAGPPSWDSVSP